MRVARLSLASLLLSFSGLLLSQAGPLQASPSHKPQPSNSFGDTPLAFESNEGQAPREIQFLSHSAESSVELGGDRAIFSLSGQTTSQPSSKDQENPHTVMFQWLGSDEHAKAAGEDELPGRTNYLVGDRQHWLRGIRNYGRVRYRSLYPGVDLVYYGNHRKLEYDLELAPQAEVGKIALGVQGADQLIPQADGSLVVKSRGGDMEWQKPIAYQMKDGQRIDVRAAYKLENKKGLETVAFELGPYDHSQPLTIDPTLAYAAQIGPQWIYDFVAADSSGSAYLLTTTLTSSYPTTAGAYMTTGQFTYQPPSTVTGIHSLLAITKFSPDGSTLVYSTYLGGSQYVCSNPYNVQGNFAAGITVDSSGNAIIAGSTSDTNFPVTSNAVQTSLQDCSNSSITVSKLNADGSDLLYGTYLSSSAGQTSSTGVAVDPKDNIFVSGLWTGPGIPTTTNLSSCTNCLNMFVGKINAAGSLGYSLLFGGEVSENPAGPYVSGIAVDGSGDAYVTGSTVFPLPVVNALQPTKKAGQTAFVGEVNPGGTGFSFLSYLSGSTGSDGDGIAVDSGGNIYVAGETFDNDFPVVNAYQSENKAYAPGNAEDANGFVTKYSPGGGSYVYSTYLGASVLTSLNAIAVGPDGKAYVTGLYSPNPGSTAPANYPVTPDAFEISSPPGDVTIAISVFTVLNPSGSSLDYSTLFTGEVPNSAFILTSSVAVTPDGQSAFLAGQVDNTADADDFPVTPGAYNNPNIGVPNGTGYKLDAGFVAKFCMTCAEPANITIESPVNGASLTSPVNFVVNAYDPDGVAALQIYAVPGKVAYQTTSSSLNTNIALAPGDYNVVVQEWSNSGSYLKKTVNITVQNTAPTVAISAPSPGATVSNPVHVVATAKVNGTGTIVHYRVYSGPGVAVYDTNGSTLNASVTLPQGPVNLTVVAWDSTGAAGAASENITVNGGSGGSQVTITSPANYSTVSSPVTFAASATTTCSGGIYALQIYTDPGTLAYTTYASSVNKAISLPPGYYYGAVQAWDNCGGTFKSNVQFDVQ